MGSGYDSAWEKTRLLLCQFEELLKKHDGESDETRGFMAMHRGNKDFDAYAEQLIYEYTDPDGRSSSRRRRC